LSAIYGGTYMLNQPVDEVLMEDGKFAGVRSGSEVAKAKFVIGDPSYFPSRVAQAGRVVRIACILSHSISHTSGESTQIIIPQKQTGRHNGMRSCVLLFS
jgi:Rab GDP dissociation inhibitor